MTRLANSTVWVLAATVALAAGCDAAPGSHETSDEAADGAPGAMARAHSSDHSNEAKRARIEKMIERYQRKLPEVPAVDAESLRAELAAGSVVLVDVREADERSVSMIAGAIGKEEFERRRAELEGSSVVTYCTIGQRSGEYARELIDDGWQARNFEGSILAWTHAGGELVDSAGQPTRRVHVYGKRWNLAADGYDPVW